MSIAKKILLTIIAVAAVWIFLNFEYFSKNISYQIGSLEKIDSAKVRETMEPNQVLVPSLAITAPVLYAEEVNEDKFQELLINGIVHYPGTAKPGEPGNVYIFGHSSDNAWSKGKYKTVFALLPQIKVGVEIFISDSEGNKFVYKVLEGRVVNNNDFSVLSQATSDRKLLTLQTSYPVGTSLKRYVVVGELVE